MSRLLSTAILVSLLAIPTAFAGPSYSTSNYYQNGVITENNVQVIDVYNHQNIRCRVSQGDRVKVWSRMPNGRIRITFGTRCHGTIKSRQVRIGDVQQEVYTLGQWSQYGDTVPVFKTQRDYFNARDRNNIENVVCRLKKGMHVEFTPYRDWGLGEVVRDDCRGWVDRGVIR